jgi:hypothetical protein
MQGSRKVRVAVSLWLILGVVVWNVVFDRVLVVAGRRYVYAATRSWRDEGAYIAIDDWMRPAIARGVLVASAAGATVSALGLLAVIAAVKRERRRAHLSNSNK